MAKSTEVKVKASAYVSLGAGFLIALLNQVVGDTALLGALPDVLQFFVVTLVPGVVTWLGGYLTPSKTSTVSDAYSGRPVA